MINVETPSFAFVASDDTWQDNARRDYQPAAMILDRYPLSDDDVTSAFEVRHPREARVKGSLHEQLSRDVPSIESGTRLALIRWPDGTESLVSIPVDSAVPSPEVLKSAYRNGHAVGRLGRSLAPSTRVSHGQR